jgi:hypothetical protein
MECPICKESRVSRMKELWGSGEPKFWKNRKEVTFLCGSRFIYDNETNTYEEVHPCRRGNVS